MLRRQPRRASTIETDVSTASKRFQCELVFIQVDRHERCCACRWYRKQVESAHAGFCPHGTVAMKLFVTGGAGFIGSNFIRQVLGLGKAYSVINDELTYAGNLGNLDLVAGRNLRQSRRVYFMNEVSSGNRFDSRATQNGPALIQCPGCQASVLGDAHETYRCASLYECPKCDLHFWHPATMPDAAWHESAYQDRDQTATPLEPGHRFFLSDPKVPKNGRLLDVGCGVGNFLSAARQAGFEVTGIELNQNAIRFARETYGLRELFAIRPDEFHTARPEKTFDVVTFFEVLEHQGDPQGFLNTAQRCLANGDTSP